MIIYPPGTLFPIKLGELTFHVKQLNALEKNNLQQYYQSHKDGTSFVNGFELTKAVLGPALKRLDGCENPDGSPYNLRFGEDGNVTEDCLLELTQIDGHLQIVMAAQHISLRGVSDPNIEGVSIDFSSLGGGGKKSSAQASA